MPPRPLGGGVDIVPMGLVGHRARAGAHRRDHPSPQPSLPVAHALSSEIFDQQTHFRPPRMATQAVWGELLGLLWLRRQHCSPTGVLGTSCRRCLFTGQRVSASALVHLTRTRRAAAVLTRVRAAVGCGSLTATECWCGTHPVRTTRGPARPGVVRPAPTTRSSTVAGPVSPHADCIVTGQPRALSSAAGPAPSPQRTTRYSTGSSANRPSGTTPTYTPTATPTA